MRRSSSFLSAAGFVLLALAAGVSPAPAADHLDAPGLMPPGGDVALDITDIYAFQSPDCTDCTVLVMGVNGLTEAGVNAAFAKRGRYEFRVDTDGDAQRDTTFLFKFGRQRSDGAQRMAVRMRRSGEGRRTLIRFRDGRTTPLGSEPVINPGKDGVRAFAGMADDPFFFDLPGFFGLSFCATDPTPDTFAGTNVSAIVLEVPKSVLAPDGPAVGIWGVTRKGGHQIERMGRPAINTVFIPSNPLEPDEPSLKDAFNAGSPATDPGQFRSEILDTLEIFYGAGSADAAALADFLLPDLLTVDVDQPSGFPNGRGLADDVIDTELGLVTNGAITSDCVDANDVAFRASFPFVGAAHE